MENQRGRFQYKTFGFRNEWLSEYLIDPEEFWDSNSLGPAQVDGFKAWLRDAEIIDNKNTLTPFGLLAKDLYGSDSDLVWELVYINLSYHSFIINWFVNNVGIGEHYDKKHLVDKISESNTGAPIRTIENAVTALMQTFNSSPIGDQFGNMREIDNSTYCRMTSDELSNVGLAYSIYRFAEEFDTKALRISDFFGTDTSNGPAKLFNMDRDAIEKRLRSLNSEKNRVLTAELNMGLQHITLRDDLSSANLIQVMLEL